MTKAEVKLRFEVNANAETEKIESIENANELLKPQNTSYKTENGIYTKNQIKTKGISGLSWAYGYLKFNESGYVIGADGKYGVLTSEDEPIEYVWGATNEVGELKDINGENLKLVITGQSDNLKDVVMYGDEVSGQFPIMAIIDGAHTIYNSSPLWIIPFGEEKKSHTIEFVKWNRPKYNAVITDIKVILRYYDMTFSNGLKSCEGLQQLMPQGEDISYNIIAKRGSAEYIDKNGEILSLSLSGLILRDKQDCDFIVNGNNIGRYFVSSANQTNYEGNIELNDAVDFLENTQMSKNIPVPFPPLPTARTLFSMADSIFTDLVNYGSNAFGSINAFTNKIVVLDKSDSGEFIYKEITIYDYFRKINIPIRYLERSSYATAIKKVCQLAQVGCALSWNSLSYKNDFKYYSVKPIFKSDIILCIPAKMQCGRPNRNDFKRNKYDGVDIERTIISKDAKTNVNVITQTNYLPPQADMIYDEQKDQNANTVSTTYETEEEEARAFAYIKVKYVDITFSVPISDKNKQITSVRTIFADTKYSYDIYKNSGDVYGKYNEISDTSEAINWGHPTAQKREQDTFPDSSVENAYSVSHAPYGKEAKASVSSRENKTLNFVKQGEKWSATARVLAYRETIKRYGQKTLNGYHQDAEREILNTITVSINGNTTEFSFNNESEHYGGVNNICSLEQNELMQNGTVYTYDDGTIIDMGEYAAQNIITDYAQGISYMTLTVVCDDVYDINGKLIKKFSKGEMFEKGDIVRVDKDNKGTSYSKYSNGDDVYYRITGINHRYSGVLLIDLELQECKKVA